MEREGKHLDMEGMVFHRGSVVFTLFCLCTYLKHLWKTTYPVNILKLISKIFTLNLNGYTTCNFRYHVYVILFTIKQVHHSFIGILNIVAICCLSSSIKQIQEQTFLLQIFCIISFSQTCIFIPLLHRILP